jgi:hypothetical protein
VSNHWSYPQVWHLLKPLLFCSGDTKDLINPDEKEKLEIAMNCVNVVAS